MLDHWFEAVCLPSCERCSYPEIQFYSCSDSTCLFLIQRSKILGGMQDVAVTQMSGTSFQGNGDRADLLLLDVAEFRSFHLKALIDSQSNVANFSANVLAFAVTVSPNTQGSSISSVRFNVLLYALFVLL